MQTGTADNMETPPNFCYPIRDLSNRRIKLTPFNVSRTIHRQMTTVIANVTEYLPYISPPFIYLRTSRSRPHIPNYTPT